MLSTANLDSRFVVDCSGSHTLLNLSRHSQERLLNVGSILGRGLQERNPETVGKFLCHGVLDDLLVCHIALVSHEELVDTLRRVAIDLLQPLFNVVEGIHVSHIKDYTDSMCTSVVGRSNGPESFLPSCVPNLELHCLSIELDRTDFKVDADSGDVALSVGVVRKSKQQTRLSDTRVSDKEKLEKVIVFWGDHGDCGIGSR